MINTKSKEVKFLSASLKFNSASEMFEADIEVMVDAKKLADRQDFTKTDVANLMVEAKLDDSQNLITIKTFTAKEILQNRIIKIAKHLHMPESSYQQCIDEAFENLTIDNI